MSLHVVGLRLLRSPTRFPPPAPAGTMLGDEQGPKCNDLLVPDDYSIVLY